MQQLHDDGIVAGGIHDDLAFERDGIHVDDVMAGHFSRGVVDHHPFEDAVAPKNQIDHSREVHDLGAASVGGSDQRAGRMRGIDHVHALAFR